jgi:hypothetical protein
MERDANWITSSSRNRERFQKLRDPTFFDEAQFMKQSQWMSLKRDAVEYCVSHDHTDVFGDGFFAPDEHYFINILNKANIPVLNRCCTFVNWKDQSVSPLCQRPLPTTYTQLTNEVLQVLRTDYLFMRKVHASCELPSFFDTMRPLNFIHITKTGGTAIENAFQAHGMHVGRHQADGYFWHAVVPDAIRSKYNWFTVVREPYSRCVSEYHCKWGNPLRNDGTVADFNQTVRTGIESRHACGTGRYTGHWESQTKFVFPGVAILKFENLQQDLDQLLHRVGLKPISIPVTNRAIQSTFTVDDLDTLSISVINRAYTQDFERFGYPMRSTTDGVKQLTVNFPL